MKFSIDSSILRAHLVHTPRSDIRDHLNNVCVDFSNPNGVFLVSTDGHRLLVTWTLFDYSVSSGWPKTLLIPQAFLKLALVGQKNSIMVEFTKKASAGYLVTITSSKNVVQSTLASTEKYGDWRSVVLPVAQAQEIKTTLTFMSKLVEDAAKTLQFINPVAPFRISRQTERGVFLDAGPLALYILMPLKGIDTPPFALPDWLDEKKTRLADLGSSCGD